MKSLYDKNGLIFWTEDEIRIRQVIVNHCVAAVRNNLRSQNRAWELVQVEATQLMPSEFIGEQYYRDNSAFFMADCPEESQSGTDFALRPETTHGSYVYAQYLLETHSGYKMPLCVWQHGKSFRREKDFPFKYMRLKEFYQLEFQCIYSSSTMCDYSLELIPAVKTAISEMIGLCRVEPSDRVPAYAEWTQDIICEATNMEVCSTSLRKDYPSAKVLEVAIGTDRCIWNFAQKTKESNDL